ncbi:MAG: hypothetical protein Q4C47_02275, partial [Planctomycetia bacterium]|nr:hypothetical protein [Planctomycetia bacterium]
MTKNELLNWLSEQSFCDAVTGGPTLIETKPDGSKWYSVTIRETNGNTAIFRNIHFYVTAEGNDSEQAYWKDREPEASLGAESTPAYKMITFRTLIDAVGSEMTGSIITKLKAASEQNVIIEQAYRMLETYGPDGGIDINSVNTQNTILSLVTAGVLTQTEAD